MTGNAAAQQTAHGQAGADPDCATAMETSGSTMTLTENCTTDHTITVPDGATLNGADHTITAVNPMGGGFSGAVLENQQVPGSTMHLRNLTVVGNPDDTTVDYGVLFSHASGSMDNVTVKDVTQHATNPLAWAIWIEARGDIHPQRVEITGARVTGFARTGLLAVGNVTADVSGSTFGPPDTTINETAFPDTTAQNSVQYGVGAGGVFTGNTVIGFTSGLPAPGQSTGLLLFAADGVTVSNNTFGGAATDVAIDVTAWPPPGDPDSTPSRDITIENNTISRAGPPYRPAGFEDHLGIGVAVEEGSSATLACNTFSGWNTNLAGVTQPPCITSAAELPDGTVGESYSATLEATTPNPPLTWSLAPGSSLPPGLTFTDNGDGTATLAGTPTEAGTFTFTAAATDANGDSSTRTFTITINHVVVPVTG